MIKLNLKPTITFPKKLSIDAKNNEELYAQILFLWISISQFVAQLYCISKCISKKHINKKGDREREKTPLNDLKKNGCKFSKFKIIDKQFEHNFIVLLVFKINKLL